MRSRTALALTTLVVSSFVVCQGFARRPPQGDTGSRAAQAAAAPSPGVSPAPDPDAIRDVFRFADRLEPSASLADRPSAEGEASVAIAPPERTGPRLVGLVRRSGRWLAAFSVEDTVELAAAGETVAGLTVVSVGDDGVRVRRRDGVEATLLY